MAGPLLETKLRVPRRRRDLVARARLSERLSRGAESELMLVSAPAGFGKTTLLADWLAGRASSGRAAAWVSLDQRDNDPALFWIYVVTALNTAYVLAQMQSRSCSRRSNRSKRSLPVSSTISRASPTMSCWCSTTTTSSTRAAFRMEWPFSWSTFPNTYTS